MRSTYITLVAGTFFSLSCALLFTSCCKPGSSSTWSSNPPTTAEEAAKSLDDARRHLEAWGTMTMGAPMVSVSNKPFEFDPKVTAEDLYKAGRLDGSLRVARSSSVRAGVSVDLQPELGEDEDRTDAPDASKDNAAAADVEKSSTAAIGQFTGDIATSPRLAIRQTAGDHFELSLHKFLSKPEHLDSDYRIVYMVFDVSCIPGWRTREGFRGRIEAQIEYDYGDSTPDVQSNRFPQVIALYPQMESQVLDLRSSARSLRAFGLALAAAGNTVGANAFLDAATKTEADSQTRSDFTVSSAFTNGGRHFGFTFEPKFAAQDPKKSGKPKTIEFQQSVTFPAVAIVAVHKRDYMDALWTSASTLSKDMRATLVRDVLASPSLAQKLVLIDAPGIIGEVIDRRTKAECAVTTRDIDEWVKPEKEAVPANAKQPDMKIQSLLNNANDRVREGPTTEAVFAAQILEQVRADKLDSGKIDEPVTDKDIEAAIAKLAAAPIKRSELDTLMKGVNVNELLGQLNSRRELIAALEKQLEKALAERPLGTCTVKLKLPQPLVLAERIVDLLENRYLELHGIGLRARTTRTWSPVGSTTPHTDDFASDRESEAVIYQLARKLDLAEAFATGAPLCASCESLRRAGKSPISACAACKPLVDNYSYWRADNELLTRVRSARADLFSIDPAIRLPGKLFSPPPADLAVTSVEPPSGFIRSGAVFIIRGANMADAKVELIDGATGKAADGITLGAAVASKNAVAVMIDATKLTVPARGLAFKVTVGSQSAFSPPIRFDGPTDRQPASLEIQRDVAGHITRITLPPALVPKGDDPHPQVAAYLKALLEELRINQPAPGTSADIDIDIKAEQKPKQP